MWFYRATSGENDLSLAGAWICDCARNSEKWSWDHYAQDHAKEEPKWPFFIGQCYLSAPKATTLGNLYIALPLNKFEQGRFLTGRVLGGEATKLSTHCSITGCRGLHCKKGRRRATWLALNHTYHVWNQMCTFSWQCCDLIFFHLEPLANLLHLKVQYFQPKQCFHHRTVTPRTWMPSSHHAWRQDAIYPLGGYWYWMINYCH